MTLPTREELDRFSDTVGRAVVVGDGNGVPAADRHIDRLRQIKSRVAHRRMTFSIESEIEGRFGVACVANVG